MSVSLNQTSLSAGEISPELYGEVDLKKINSAATTLRNAFVNYKGGAKSRGGLAAVGVSLQSTFLQAGTSTGPPRPIPFAFSITQGYILEFGDNYLRFVFDGGYVLEPPVTITGATQANPCAIDVTGSPFNIGDWVFIAAVQGMTQLNGNTYIVSGGASGHFTITDLQGNAVNSTGFGAYTGGGTVSRLYTILNAPYAAVDLPYLKYSQSADVMRLTCVNQVTGTEYPPYELIRLGATDWTLMPINLDPAITPPASISAVSNSLAPSTGINATFAYVVTAVDAEGNESVASAVAYCNGADIEVEGGSNSITWPFVSGAKYYNIYRSPASTDNLSGATLPPPGSLFGFVGSSYGTQFSDTSPTIDLSQTPPIHQDPFARGQILAVDITSAGAGLAGVTYAITTIAGIDFAGYPAVVGGSLGAFPITNNGKQYQPGDSIAFNGAGYAAGAIDFSVNPTAADTITLNTVVWTFVSVVTAPAQTQIKGALSATLAQLQIDLAASVNPLITVANYTIDVTRKNLLINYNTAGAAGNAYTLAASAATPSGAHLTGGGGTASPSVPTATLEIGPETGTYPGVNAYFQQRGFFANSLNNPDTFWASQTSLYYNFDISIPPVATDAITASPWTEQVNGIQWLVPMPGGLIALTGSRAWQIVGEGSYALNSQPITPATTQAQPQAFNGCSATIPPIVIDYDVLYVEAIGNSTVRDLSYNFFTSIYTGNDLTILSSHLFLYRSIVQWAWARTPYKVLWACCDDGTMLSMTYLKEQEVYGWARHDTQGLVVGLASITEPPVDAVYAMVQRFPPYAPQGIYVMERMDDRIWQSVEDAYAVDSGVSNPMTTPEVALFASTNSGAGAIFTATGAAFSAASVGQVIRMGGGIATVTAYTSSIKVTGTWNLAASNGPTGLPYAAAGRWTIAKPVTALNAPHIAGMTLVGLADGVPISGLVVGAAGAITLPFSASDVKTGLGYAVQIQTPYLNGQGVVQGARKVVPAATVRVAASAPWQVGTNQIDGAAQNPPTIGPIWTDMAMVDFSQPTGGQTAPMTYTSPGGQLVTQLMTGDHRQIGKGAAWSSKGQIAVQQLLPTALEITSVAPEVVDGDVPERGYSPQQQSQGQSPRPPGRHMLAA